MNTSLRLWGKGKRKMSNSSLVTRVDYAHPSNYTQGRSLGLRGIVIHHACATTIDSVARTFQTPGRNGSAHYTVCGNQISLMVDESNTAWHCGEWGGNSCTIGIETCNSDLGGNWPIAEDTFNTLVKLVAEIARRNGFGKLQYLPDGDGTGITGHRDWVGSATSCPGPSLYPRLRELVEKANAINYPPVQTISWARMTTPRVMVAKAGAQLVDIKTGRLVKAYNEDTEINMYDRGTYNGKTYYRSKYSHDNGIENGIINTMVVEKPTPAPDPEPEPAPKIQWTDLDKKLGLFTNGSAKLIDLDTGEVKQTYTSNTKIDVVQTTEYNGKTWYRTEYSTTKGFNWAFEASMFVWDEPTQPEPSEPSNPPINSTDDEDSSPNSSSTSDTPSDENKNESKTDDSQDGSGSSRNWVIMVINAIIELIKKFINLITTKKGE